MNGMLASKVGEGFSFFIPIYLLDLLTPKNYIKKL
jgi:hypothetical protein